MGTWTKLVLCWVQKVPGALHGKLDETNQVVQVDQAVHVVQVVDSRCVGEPKAELAEEKRAWEVVLGHPGREAHRKLG